MRRQNKVIYNGKKLNEVQSYKLKEGQAYKIIDLKPKNKATLFNGRVVKNYIDYIIFHNGIYQECFRKSDLVGMYLKVEEVA